MGRARAVAVRGTAWVELGVVPGGYGWVFPKGDHANLGVGGWMEEGPSLRAHLDRLARAHGVEPSALDRRSRVTAFRCACSARRPHVVASFSSETRPASSIHFRETGSTRPSSQPARGRRDPRRSTRAVRGRTLRRPRSACRSSWKAKRAADRYPARLSVGASRTRRLRCSRRVLRGDLAHPSEARRLARPPLRGLSRLARQAPGRGSDPRV